MLHTYPQYRPCLAEKHVTFNPYALAWLREHREGKSCTFYFLSQVNDRRDEPTRLLPQRAHTEAKPAVDRLRPAGGPTDGSNAAAGGRASFGGNHCTARAEPAGESAPGHGHSRCDRAGVIGLGRPDTRGAYLAGRGQALFCQKQ